ncbi:uncharacterized protein LOC108199788 isoform X1 [Daucus carota subsp. sativus]|uniref:uncharacterized protein LOC108199788 isoform X1 n=1 Tax=Daucus carota subsp. sativus TaxID=79200 RepID=UPI0007EF2F03|nr:PREDICTED: uncharacterized protein LOC108199788 isoform X1 [Daucus carota subsp. sativus]
MDVLKGRLGSCPSCGYLLPHHFSLDHCASCGAAFPGKERLFSATSYTGSSSALSVGDSELLGEFVSGREDTVGLSSNRNSRFKNYGYGEGMRQSRIPTDYGIDPNVDSFENDSRDTAYQLEDIRQRFNGLDGLTKVDSSEHDRAELVRKLNELKDQLSRLDNAVEHPIRSTGTDERKVRSPPNLYYGQEPSIPESSASLYNLKMQHPSRDRHDLRPLYHDRQKPFQHDQSYDVHAPRHVPYENLQHKDAYRPQMARPPPHQSFNQYLPWTNPDHFNGPSTDFSEDAPTSLPHETFFHQHGCSCSQCYSKSRKVPQKVPSPPNGNYYQLGNPIANGSLYSIPKNLAPPLDSQDPQPLTRNLRDLDTGNGAYVQLQKRRLVIGHENKRVFHPIAGGAPIVTCPICFELLKLPRKLMLVENNERKMCCGGCSTIVLCELDRKGIVISVLEKSNQSSERDDHSAEKLSENIRVSVSNSDAGVTNSESKDYNSSGYTYQLTDKESNLSQDDRHSDAAETRQESSLSFSSFSEDEILQDSETVQRVDLKSVKPPSKDNEFPLQEHHDNELNSAISKDEKGGKGKRSYMGKLFQKLTNSRRNSAKDVTAASETDISSDAYMNSGVTQDSREENIEEEHPKIKKRTESIFSGLREYRSEDFSDSILSMEFEESYVYVNGQNIPQLAVKKAEKLAGPIEPGEYWYDFQAGFWGVMGHPCLGIIAPYINAFNYPMPEGCAAGNTGVFVNGRELNQGDLNKLATRGLPVTKHNSYIMKISGKVLDAETREVLYNLGKLAPTVQRARRGFGMKVPKSLRNDQESG